MRLHEVLESGRKFRRKSQPDEVFDPPKMNYTFSVKEILVNDWEIFEEKIELTESQFEEIFWDNVNEIDVPDKRTYQIELYKLMTQKLGFGGEK